MGDSLCSGRSDRLPFVQDKGNREAVSIKANVSLPITRMVLLIDDLVARHGVPRWLRCDIWRQFIAEALRGGAPCAA